MSSMRNHIKRSHRSEAAKRGVYSARSYKAMFRANQQKKENGLRKLVRAIVGKHAGGHSNQRQTRKQADAQ